MKPKDFEDPVALGDPSTASHHLDSPRSDPRWAASALASAVVLVAACGSDAGLDSAAREHPWPTAGAPASDPVPVDAASARTATSAATSAGGFGGDSEPMPGACGLRSTSTPGASIASLTAGFAGLDARAAELDAQLRALSARLGLPIELDEDIVFSLMNGESCSVVATRTGSVSVECTDSGDD